MKTNITLAGAAATLDPAHIEKSLEAVPGVVAVEVDNYEVTIEHEDANQDELTNALRKLGVGA